MILIRILCKEGFGSTCVFLYRSLATAFKPYFPGNLEFVIEQFLNTNYDSSLNTCIFNNVPYFYRCYVKL